MSDIDRIGEELRKRVLQDGVIFLEQEGKLNGILADMFPELKKERRWIRMAMESGTGKMFSRITSCTNENEKQNLYQQIKSQIEEDGLAEAAIDYVLTVFCSAIDWKMESVRETSGSNGSSYQEEISYGGREASSGSYRSDGAGRFQSMPEASAADRPRRTLGATTNADIVFVIDATDSMSPILNTVKNFTMSLHEKVIQGLQQYHRKIKQLRVKVIAFRDYYCDGRMSLDESPFFYLPEENADFKDFVTRIEAKGGGDEPESGLEALALAMGSDWETSGTSKRHAIVLFTDASAHPLEQQLDGIPGNYPSPMLSSYEELMKAWDGELHGEESIYNMDRNARRLILFTPDTAPWNRIRENFDVTVWNPTMQDQGGADLNMDLIINTLCKSLK